MQIQQIERAIIRSIELCLIAVLITLLLSDKAIACRVPRVILENLQDINYLYELSEYVVLAKAISSQSKGNSTYTTFSPLKIWKGEKSKKIVARGRVGPCGVTPYSFTIGNQYLLYLFADEKKWYWPWSSTYTTLSHQVPNFTS